jgi:Uma2 family endonuclease
VDRIWATIDTIGNRNPYHRDRPRVLIEILSPSAERIDRTEKGEAYRQIDSLWEYVLITQDQRCVDVQRRKNGWGSEVYEKTGRVRLPCLDLELDLDAVYADSGVTAGQADPGAPPAPSACLLKALAGYPVRAS